MPILTPEERVGTTVAGKYKLDRIIAVGGMGTVYAGQHEWTHRDVAVKILNYEHARKPDIVKRFLQEARAAANLRHPNVVDVLDMGEAADGSVYLVLELLEGQTLKARMRKGRIPFKELVDHITPVMDALAEAHAKGVIHRDLKPDNIFLAGEDPVVPKLLDFGIAKVLGGDSSQTGTGVMIGTPQYMAPEQVRGERMVGPAADVWSLGVVLFGALSGRLPFRGDSPAATIAKVLVEEPPKLRQVAPSVPMPIAAVVDKALSKHPADRHDSVLAMKQALLAARELAGNDFETVTDTDVSPVVPTVRLDNADLSPAPGTPPPEEESDRTLHTPTPAPVLAAAAEAKAREAASAPSVPPSAVVPSETPYTWSTTSDVGTIEKAPIIPAWWIAVGAAAVVALFAGASLTIWVVASTEGDENKSASPSTHAATAPPPVAAEPDAGLRVVAAPTPTEDPLPRVAEPPEVAPTPSTPETEPTPPAQAEETPASGRSGTEPTRPRVGAGSSSGRRRSGRRTRRDPARGTGGALILR